MSRAKTDSNERTTRNVRWFPTFIPSREVRKRGLARLVRVLRVVKRLLPNLSPWAVRVSTGAEHCWHRKITAVHVFVPQSDQRLEVQFCHCRIRKCVQHSCGAKVSSTAKACASVIPCEIIPPMLLAQPFYIVDNVPVTPSVPCGRVCG
jgi:hypothetical protein